MNATIWSFAAIGIGAALGAWLRWALSLWLNLRHPFFPLGTFAANVIGGFLVGVAVAYFSDHAELSPVWRVLVITGFLGGLTTFSSYSAEVVSLFERGHVGWGFSVAVAHLLVSLAFTAVGLWLYRAL